MSNVYLTNSASPGNKIIFTDSGSGVKTYFTIYVNPGTTNNLFADWSTRIASSTEYNRIRSLVAESNGNVYVTGIYNATCTLYNSSGTTFGTLAQKTAGSNDGYIVKYNTSGTVQWAAHIGDQTELYGLCVDPGGNVYVTGAFYSNPVSIYNANGTAFGTLTNLGSRNVPVVKYNTSGTVQWAARLGGNDFDFGFVMSSDTGSNVFVGGEFASWDAFNVYNGNGTLYGQIFVAGWVDGWFVKYNTAGTVQWTGHVSCGGGGLSAVTAIGTDPSNASVVIGGRYSTNSLLLNPPSGSDVTMPNSGGQDGMILKFNAAGVTQWVTRLSNLVDVRSISVNSTGDVYVAGTCYNGYTLNIYSANGTGTPTLYGTLTNDGFGMVYLIKYNSSGVVQWATRIAGSGTDECRTASLDTLGNIVLCGWSDSAPMTIYNAGGSTFGTFTNGCLAIGFVVVYNSSGTAQYASKLLTAGNSFPYGMGIATDGSNGVYAGGYYATNMTIYNSSGTTFGTLTGDATYDNSYIIKY
jgi:hypothetical protein